MQINPRETHQQKERQKPHDDLNRCIKVFDKIQHPFMIKVKVKVKLLSRVRLFASCGL